MIIREKLAELIVKQSIESEDWIDFGFNDLQEHQQKKVLKQADEIIAFFVDAIKGLEFNVPTL